jgi:hypothetical protein
MPRWASAFNRTIGEEWCEWPLELRAASEPRFGAAALIGRHDRRGRAEGRNGVSELLGESQHQQRPVVFGVFPGWFDSAPLLSARGRRPRSFCARASREQGAGFVNCEQTAVGQPADTKRPAAIAAAPKCLTITTEFAVCVCGVCPRGMPADHDKGVRGIISSSDTSSSSSSSYFFAGCRALKRVAPGQPTEVLCP